MKKNIITISREFGSGGRTIGKTVAERLGVPCYDKELVKQVALESGFDPKFIEERGESAPGKNRFAYAFLGRGTPGVMGGMSASDFLWTIQYRVIQDLAEKGPCVIVGRCADYILREREDCLHTFIHASVPFRADRIVRLYGESEKAPEKAAGGQGYPPPGELQALHRPGVGHGPELPHHPGLRRAGHRPVRGDHPGPAQRDYPENK